jgi:hypothetical protein
MSVTIPFTRENDIFVAYSLVTQRVGFETNTDNFILRQLEVSIETNAGNDYFASTRCLILPYLVKFGLFACSEFALTKIINSVEPFGARNFAILASASFLARFFYTSAHVNTIAVESANFIVNLQGKLACWLSNLLTENATYLANFRN